jgi:hypothetical protein
LEIRRSDCRKWRFRASNFPGGACPSTP